MLWQVKRRIEQRYQNAIHDLLQACVGAYAKNTSLEEFEQMMRMYASSEAFLGFANSLAEMMITGLFDDLGRSWREAARNNMQGREVYDLLINDLAGARGEAMHRMIYENASLIRTLPTSVAKQVSEYTMREALKGRRPEDIEGEITKLFPRRSKARAKLIARTEVSKAQSALIQSDCELIGVDWYIWHSTHDQRARYSHQKMDGIICSWHDPPNPEKLFPGPRSKPYGEYHPGDTFNCRCYPEPLVTKSQIIQNTYRVCINGRLIIMKRSDVIRLIAV